MGMELIDKLRAALDEDERVARAAVNWSYGAQQWADSGEPDWTHIARHDPARVLRQVAVIRKILDLHKPIQPVDYPGRDDVVYSAKVVCANCGPTGNDPQTYIFETSDNPAIWYPCSTLLALAEAYGINPAPTETDTPDDHAD